MTSIFGQCSAFKTRPEVSKPLRDRLFEVRPVTMSYYSRTGDLMQSILHLVFVFVLWGRLRALPPPPSTHFFPLSVFVSSLARGSCAASSSSPQFVSLSLSLKIYLYPPPPLPQKTEKFPPLFRKVSRGTAHCIGCRTRNKRTGINWREENGREGRGYTWGEVSVRKEKREKREKRKKESLRSRKDSRKTRCRFLLLLLSHFLGHIRLARLVRFGFRRLKGVYPFKTDRTWSSFS